MKMRAQAHFCPLSGRSRFRKKVKEMFAQRVFLFYNARKVRLTLRHAAKKAVRYGHNCYKGRK